MNNLHIHAPHATVRMIKTDVCPDCKKRSRFVGFFTEWYGWNSTCLRCGREWYGGEWSPLDFARGVRQRNIDAAKKHWREFEGETLR